MFTAHALHHTSLWSNHLHDSKSVIASLDMLHFIFGTSFLHHSEFLIQIIHPPLSDLHLNMPVWLATHCYHLPSLFTVSLWAQNLPFQKIIFSTLVCFCLSDWPHGSTPFTGFICWSVLCFSSISFCFSYFYVRLTKLAWSTLGARKNTAWLIDCLINKIVEYLNFFRRS